MKVKWCKNFEKSWENCIWHSTKSQLYKDTLVNKDYFKGSEVICQEVIHQGPVLKTFTMCRVWATQACWVNPSQFTETQ